MDEFGVLVERYGVKTQGKSTPLANLKAKKINNGGQPKPSPPVNDFLAEDLDNIFLSSTKSTNYYDDSNDIFGGPFAKATPGNVHIDLDSVFSTSSNNSNVPKQGGGFPDDLFGNFPGPKSDGSRSNNSGVGGSQFDDLIPGFSSASPSSNGERTEANFSPQSGGLSSKSSPTIADDPFLVFESAASPQNSSSWPFSDPLEQGAERSAAQSSIDELEDFARGGAQNDANERSSIPFGDNVVSGTSTQKNMDRAQEKFRIKVPINKTRVETASDAKSSTKEMDGIAKNGVNGREHRAKQDTIDHRQSNKDGVAARMKDGNDLDSLFGSAAQRTHVERSRSSNEDTLFDSLFQGKGESKLEHASSKPSFSTKEATSGLNYDDDFSFLFGEAAPSTVEFKEVDGESEERRKARFNHHMRTKARMAQALAEKNQRDLQVQHEQDERRRLAETMDSTIKRWAAGKEGNLRALLSSLQQVLWPECGWQPISLTDMITSQSVKKVYYKATLCVHPDKVQQKGADLQQKYIAEKVFDLLKEAFNKFNAEELR